MADLDDVRMLAERLMTQHLGASAQPWTFRFDNAKKRGGVCNHALRTISLSKYLTALWSMEECEQVILHEIAHALAPSHHRHTATWLGIARSIGYTSGVTHHNAIALDKATWRGVCPAGHEYFRFRKPYHRKESCAKCHRGYSDDHRIAWEFRG